MMKRGLLALVAILLSTVIIPSVFATPYGLGTYGSCTYNQTCTITMSTSSPVSLNTSPTASGVYTIDNDQVTVTTNSTDGYILSLESDLGYPFGGSLIAPGWLTVPGVAGTPASPQTLSNNTWGFRVDDLGSFGSGPTSNIQNQSSSSLTFASVSLNGSPETIKTNITGSPSGEITNVWYGIKTTSSQQAGNYSATVVYTAIMQ